MTKSMHVLHLAHLYWPAASGSGRVFFELGKRLVQDGHRVTTLATEALDLEHLWVSGRRFISQKEDCHDGVRVLRLAVKRLPSAHLLYPVTRRLMVEISRLPIPQRLMIPILCRMSLLNPRLPELTHMLEQSPEFADVTLVHTTNITLDFAILPILAWAKQRNIPHICTPFVHLGEPGNPQIVKYYTMPHQIDILRQSRAIITQTHLEEDYLQRKGVPAHLMHTIGAGINPEELAGGQADRFRQQHAINGPIVLTIGVAAFDKGTFHVVEAMQRLWAQGCAATWVQVGPLMGHFEHFVKTLPEHDHARMRILGFVSDETRQDALAAADVFVLPSRTDSFGIVYLEAWNYGVPVIGARAGGVAEIIHHGSDGLLVPFGDVVALSQAIGRLLQDDTLSHALGEVGRKRVLRELTWDYKYAQIRKVYTSAVEQ